MYNGVMYSRKLKIKHENSFFLFGPRGVGKSSWVRLTYPKAIYIDLLDTRIQIELLAKPSRLNEKIPASYQDWVIIDEVQKCPSLLDEVHRAIEGKSQKFILTGSSARKLRKGGVNLLAGRAYTHFMHPLTPKELGKDFELERALERGLLPKAYQSAQYQEFLASYVQTYIKEEVFQEALTRNAGSFYRFLEAVSFSQGSLLNMTAVARDCSVHRKVVENYLSILEDLLIASRLMPFTRRSKRRLAQSPKFYFFDAGVFRTIRPSGPLDQPEEIEGIALETLVYQVLRASIEYGECKDQLFFWRTSSGQEVDFVIYGESGITAIEVKRSSRFHHQDLSGLKSFLKDYPQARAILLYMGEETRYLSQNLTILPAKKFLLSPLS
jgi:uncharacterized protein